MKEVTVLFTAIFSIIALVGSYAAYQRTEKLTDCNKLGGFYTEGQCANIKTINNNGE